MQAALAGGLDARRGGRAVGRGRPLIAVSSAPTIELPRVGQPAGEQSQVAAVAGQRVLRQSVRQPQRVDEFVDQRGVSAGMFMPQQPAS